MFVRVTSICEIMFLAVITDQVKRRWTARIPSSINSAVKNIVELRTHRKEREKYREPTAQPRMLRNSFVAPTSMRFVISIAGWYIVTTVRRTCREVGRETPRCVLAGAVRLRAVVKLFTAPRFYWDPPRR